MGLVAETAVQRVTVPHEDAWIEIQPLSWSDLETARRIKTEDSIKQAALFDASMLKEIQASATGGTATPADGLDMATVLTAGVKSWSYEDPVTPENIRRLDEPTAMFAFAQIAERSVLNEDESKNGQAPQGGHS